MSILDIFRKNIVKGEFKKDLSKTIAEAIADGELAHRGEIKVVIDNSLSLYESLRGVSTRKKALDYFKHYDIWETDENTGILIYFLLSRNEVEIVPDRGIYERFTKRKWNELSEEIENKLRKTDIRIASVFAINECSNILAEYFPALKDNENEISDKPIIK